MTKRAVSSGFTLIELMVVFAVVAVLQTLAVPAFSGVVATIRLTSAVNSLLSSLWLARSESIKRNSRVVVCKSASGSACASSGGWEQGWIVFHDANNDAALNAGESVISREQALPSLIRLRGNAPVTSYVSYTSAGSARYVTGAFQAGTLTVCTESANLVDARQLVISISGRPRTVRTTVAQCPL